MLYFYNLYTHTIFSDDFSRKVYARLTKVFFRSIDVNNDKIKSFINFIDKLLSLKEGDICVYTKNVY